MLQDLESATILHEHLHVPTFKLKVINFHNLLDCLQDVRFRNFKLLFPHPTLHLYSASCSKTEVQGSRIIQTQELPYFRKKDDFSAHPLGSEGRERIGKRGRERMREDFWEPSSGGESRESLKTKYVQIKEKKTELKKACIRQFSAAGPDDRES